MKPIWFKRKGVFFVPASITGWAIMLACIIAAVYFFIDIDSRSHSASDTIRPFLVDLLMIILVYRLVAYFTSQRPEEK